MLKFSPSLRAAARLQNIFWSCTHARASDTVCSAAKNWKRCQLVAFQCNWPSTNPLATARFKAPFGHLLVVPVMIIWEMYEHLCILRTWSQNNIIELNPRSVTNVFLNILQCSVQILGVQCFPYSHLCRKLFFPFLALSDCPRRAHSVGGVHFGHIPCTFHDCACCPPHFFYNHLIHFKHVATCFSEPSLNVRR